MTTFVAGVTIMFSDGHIITSIGCVIGDDEDRLEAKERLIQTARRNSANCGIRLENGI